MSARVPEGRSVTELLAEYCETRIGDTATVDENRARVVTAFADTALARLDTELSVPGTNIPNRTDDLRWHLSWSYCRAVAVHRAEQTIEAVADAMVLHERGRVMSGWAVLVRAAELHARVFRFVDAPVVDTHLQEAYDAVAAWNAVAEAAEDVSTLPLGGERFEFLGSFPDRDPLGPRTIGVSGLEYETQRVLDAGKALAGAHLGSCSLVSAEFRSLQPDLAARDFGDDVAALQAVVAVDLIESAAGIALCFTSSGGGAGSGQAEIRKDVTAAARFAREALTAPSLHHR